MITNTGKEIISKYMLGIAPAYASYIALGCGAQPLSSVSSFGDYSSKTQLDFEMFRVPITSRGYINDGGVNKIVLTAELPTEERYEITEVGIYSAGANASAGTYDSKTISAFSNTEKWSYVSGATVTSPEVITNSIIDSSNNITSLSSAIQTNANNAGFLNTTRAARFERCRYLNNIYMLRGNTSHISSDTGGFSVNSVNSAPGFLQLSGQTVDLSKNSVGDLLKVAFSIVNVYGDAAQVPDKVRVLVEFASNDNIQYARLEAEALNSTYDFNSNRYMVISKSLDSLKYNSSGTPFSWNNVSVVKVYASAINNYVVTAKSASGSIVTLTSAGHNLAVGDIVVIPTSMGTGYSGTFAVTASNTGAGTFSYVATTTPGAGGSGLSISIEAASSKYFIALDAVRLDNVSSVNPLYGLTGYSVVKSASGPGVAIVKSSNTSSYIEFRFSMDVV